jgi:hypothetical protein
MLSLATGRLADVAVISTQDRDHAGPALSALEHGYHLLLEKPAASTLDECRAILATARAQDRRVILCYVLRHTPFYRTVREFVDSGKLGDLITIHATEGVEPWHQGCAAGRAGAQRWSAGRATLVPPARQRGDSDRPVPALTAEGYHGHGGGDFGLIDSLDHLIGTPAGATFAREGWFESHLIGFAAEQSRRDGGRCIDLAALR